MPDRVVRSLLFVPADSERKIEKSRDSGADVLIFDLEDSVHPQNKPEARRILRDVLKQELASRKFVRVNGLRSGLIDADLEAIAAVPPPVLMLPKCESSDDIEAVSQRLDRLGLDQVKLLPVVTETVRALRNLMRSDWSHPRLYGMTWGAEDISADLGSMTNRENGVYTGVYGLARETCLLAAKEASVLAFDTAFIDVRDGQACLAESAQSFRAGFDGKLAIHPSQVEIIHRTFRPTGADVDWAKAVLAALAESGQGVAVLGGQMIDIPHQKKAEKILRLAGEG